VAAAVDSAAETAMEVDMAVDQAAVPAAAAARVALVAGATGLVGQAVLAVLLTDKRYSAVHCVGRNPPGVKHPRLFGHLVDFHSMESLPGMEHVDDVFIALGTTIKVAGSKAAFRTIDVDAVVAVARLGKSIGATKLGVVSAMGASPDSTVFFNRIKGEMELVLTQLGYPVLVIARPSMLAGDRDTLLQASRPAERLGLMAMQLFKPLIPKNYRAIHATKVAQALTSAVHETERGQRVLLSGEMQ
jgi:uncharacterized protein YbjT (DUF2867 family)